MKTLYFMPMFPLLLALLLALMLAALPAQKSAGQTSAPANTAGVTQENSAEEKFIGAAAELERLMGHYRDKIKAASNAQLDNVKIKMGQEARAVLEKYNLTQEDLDRYRREVEAATKKPLKDPAFRNVVDKLKQ